MHIEYSDVIRGRIVRHKGSSVPLQVELKSISHSAVIVPYTGCLWDDLMDAILTEVEDHECVHTKLYHSISEYYVDLIASTTLFIKMNFQLRCAYVIAEVQMVDGRHKDAKVTVHLEKDEYDRFVDEYFGQDIDDTGLDRGPFFVQRHWATSPSMFGGFD